MKATKTFLLFFCVQCLNYAMLTWNYRAIAQARYVNIALSDLMCAALAFTLIKKVAKAETRAAFVGYVLGGACGSVLSTWITKVMFGQ